VVSRRETGPNCDLIKYIVHVNFSTEIKKLITEIKKAIGL